jgi:hypothetical protein
MKKPILLFCLVVITLTRGIAQDNDLAAIKLSVDVDRVSVDNSTVSPELIGRLKDRLYNKVIRLINETGVADIGYSSFLVVPKFEVLSNSVDGNGLSRVWLADCELTLKVERRAYNLQGETVFTSLTRRLTGSGSSADAAISDAVNNLQPTDPEVVTFFRASKEKINAYFQQHCAEVIADADQARNLHQYAKAIALYFSVPSNAPGTCAAEARASCQKIYGKYMEEDCQTKLIRLKACIARGLNTDSSAASYYDVMMLIIADVDGSCGYCCDAVVKQIEKIENRFDQKQKQEWELKKIQMADEKEIEKARAQGMARISSTYQPAPATVIIAK